MSYNFSDVFNSMKKNIESAYATMGAEGDIQNKTIHNLSGTIANALSNAGCFFLDARTEGDNITVSFKDAKEAVYGIEKYGRSVILRILDDVDLVQVASPYITLKDSETPKLLFKHPESTVKAIVVSLEDSMIIDEDRLPIKVAPLLIAGEGISLGDDGTIEARSEMPTAFILNTEIDQEKGWTIQYSNALEAMNLAKEGTLVAMYLVDETGKTQITATAYNYSEREGLGPKLSFKVPEFPNMVLSVELLPEYESTGKVPVTLSDIFKAGEGISISNDGTISLA